jgi:quercetin dioxygenase-like cupin family protein
MDSIWRGGNRLLTRAACYAICFFAASGLTAQRRVEIENQWVRVTRSVPGRFYSRLPVVDVGLNGSVQYSAGETKRVYEKGDHVLIELKAGAPKSPAVALDPVKLDAEHHIVILENTRVRVIRTILEPHLKSPRHEHPHYVVVYLTDLHTTMTMADGREVDNPRKPGDIAWRDALSHVTENIGEKTAVEIQVEIK